MQIWRARENETIRLVKKEHRQEVMALSKLHKDATPYQESIMSQRIQYLKQELKTSSTSSRPSAAVFVTVHTRA